MATIDLNKFKVAPAPAMAGASPEPATPSAPLDLNKFKVKKPSILAPLAPVAKYAGGIAEEANKGFQKNIQETGESVAEAANPANSIVRRATATGQAVERGILGPLTTATNIVFHPIGDIIQFVADKVSDIPMVQRAAASDSVGKVLDTIGHTFATVQQAEKDHPDIAPDIKNVVNLALLLTGGKPIEKAVQKGAESAVQGAKAGAEAVAGAGKAVAEGAGGILKKGGESAADVILGTKPADIGKPGIAETFKNYGIEAPVSAVTESPAVRGAEAYLQGSSFFGGPEITKIIDTARERIGAIASSLKRNAEPERLKTPGVTAESVGADLQKAVKSLTDEFNKTKTKLYTEADKRIGTQQAVVEGTRSVIDDIVGQLSQSAVPSAKSEASFFRTIGENLSTAEKRTYSALKATRTSIGQKIADAQRGLPVEGGDVGRLKRLYAALSDDMEATIRQSGDSASKAFDAANAYFKAGKEKLNSTIGTLIKRGSDRPELLVERIIKPGNVSAIRELKDILVSHPEVFDRVSHLFMNKIIDSVTNALTGKPDPRRLAQALQRYGDDTLTEIVGPRGLQELKDLTKALIADDIVSKGLNSEGKVMPGRLANAVESYDSKVLEQVFTPEELTKLKDVQAMSNAMAKGTKLVEGSPTAEKMAPFAVNFIVGAVSIPALLGKFAVEWGASKLFSSAWGRKFLTRGRIGETGQRTLAPSQTEIAKTTMSKKPSIKAETVPQESASFKYSEKGVPAEKPVTPTPPVRKNKLRK